MLWSLNEHLIVSMQWLYFPNVFEKIWSIMVPLDSLVIILLHISRPNDFMLFTYWFTTYRFSTFSGWKWVYVDVEVSCDHQVFDFLIEQKRFQLRHCFTVVPYIGRPIYADDSKIVQPLNVAKVDANHIYFSFDYSNVGHQIFVSHVDWQSSTTPICTAWLDSPVAVNVIV